MIKGIRLNLAFVRTDTGLEQASHYHFSKLEFTNNNFQCFNMFEEVKKQSHLMDYLKLNIYGYIKVSRIRLRTEVDRSYFYVDNLWIGNEEVQRRF